MRTSTAREYRSDLRARQAEETRGHILDAAVRVMARGLAYVSIPAVAQEAGVSVPTIYRHFASMRGLLGAVYPHVASRTGLDDLVPPRSMSELRYGVRALFGRLDSVDDQARAAMASPAAEEARRISMPGRLAMWRRLAETVVPQLADGDRDRIVRLLAVLINSSALRLWRDHLGSTVDEAADDIDWVIRAAVAASQKSEQ